MALFLKKTGFSYDEFNELLFAFITFIYKSGEISTITVERKITEAFPLITQSNCLKYLIYTQVLMKKLRIRHWRKIFLTKPIIK